MGAIQLKDGGLYETINGRRYRLTFDKYAGCFGCVACNMAWGRDGRVITFSDDSDDQIDNHIAREIPEMRWVSVYACDIDDLEQGAIYKTKGKHVFKQVTREQARRMAPNYTPPGAKDTTHASTTLWHGAKSELIERGGKRFIRVVTGQGKTVEIEV